MDRTYYGIPDIFFENGLRPVENAQIGCKMNMINTADHMIKQLEQIKTAFRDAQIDCYEDHLRQMQSCWNRMILVYSALDHVMDEEEPT